MIDWQLLNWLAINLSSLHILGWSKNLILSLEIIAQKMENVYLFIILVYVYFIVLIFADPFPAN